ncbi:putative F-box/kelch-repeat protein At4g02310 [Eutrema salsugineum]|nr:putative F-box/kelch-repeat protein At4g02310 [Eutrema salsugineum]
MVGSEIYFVRGYYNPNFSFHKSKWILDSRSGKMRQGPCTLVARRFAAVGLLDKNIYSFGKYKKEDEEIQVEVFDQKTQTWVVAPNPDVEVPTIRMSVVRPSLGREIYATYNNGYIIVYDSRGGKCETIDSPAGAFYGENVCMIENVLYTYKSRFGLMWFDSKYKEWRVVNGLKLSDGYVSKVAMAEYYGMLALLWERWGEKMNKEIWCSMISLDKSGVEITGKVEWIDHVLSIPSSNTIMHCLRRMD